MNHGTCQASWVAGGATFSKRRLPAGLIAGAAGLLLAAIPRHARAINLYDGLAVGNNVEVNLNITVGYTGIVRTNNPSKILTIYGANAINGNDGDLNFAHGLVSDEFEITPTLDIKDGDYGAHFSGDAYLNTSYLGTNQNHSTTVNSISTAKTNDFTSATRNVNGLNAQVLDAFVYGTEHFGADDAQEFTLKFGRQTLLWGQSLFLSNNGLAVGMAPFDVQTGDNDPTAQTQQIILPVGQVVATYAPNPVLTLQGYYQFEWEPDLLEGAGAYFNPSDILDKGGQRFLFAPDFGIPRIKNITPPINNGQFGASAQLNLGSYDIGFYGIRYDSKSPTVYFEPGPLPTGLSSYRAVYARDIWIEAASISTTVFNTVNVAGETSFRQHMNLDGGLLVSATNNANSNPTYPVGDTWAAQASAIYVSAGIPLDPGGVSYSGEIGFNHLLKVTENRAALASGRTETAAQMQFTIEPNYYGVLPNLQLGFPIGLAYNLYGRSMVDSTENHGTGDFSVGVTATYRVTWTASLLFNDYIGAANTVLNPLADRNYVMLNLQHSF